MRRSTIALVVLLASLALAGCLGEETAPTNDTPAEVEQPRVPDAWWEDAIPWGEDHEHANRSHHANLTTPNFEVVGYDPLVSDALGTTPTGMGCGGQAEDEAGRELALVHTFDTEVAFVVADVSDPENPVKLGEYLLPNVHVWDATMSADGEHALIGAYPPALKPGWEPKAPPPPGASELDPDDPETIEVQPRFRNACTGETYDAGPEQYLPLGPSIVMVGLQDPADPTFEDAVPQPVLGPHSVSSAEVDGTVYAMSSVTNLAHDATYYTFLEIASTPAGATLVPLSVIQAPGSPPTTALNGHIDVTMQAHPETGTPIAYLANWNEGVALYDMSQPRAPQRLGVWTEASQGSIHETLPLGELRDGRHLTIAGQEVGERENLPSGIVFLLDTTDPANPTEIGRWTIPVQPRGWPGLMFSTHYLDVVDDTMFVSNYHGGLWAVDIAEPQLPQATGLFVPSEPSPNPHPDAGGPSVNDVLADGNGTLTVWDANGGIYQLAFDDEMPAPKAPVWPGLEDA